MIRSSASPQNVENRCQTLTSDEYRKGRSEQVSVADVQVSEVADLLQPNWPSDRAASKKGRSEALPDP